MESGSRMTIQHQLADTAKRGAENRQRLDNAADQISVIIRRLDRLEAELGLADINAPQTIATEGAVPCEDYPDLNVKDRAF